MPDDDVLVKVSKVSDKGLVTIPLETRRKLGLAPGTLMIFIAAEEALLRKEGDAVRQGAAREAAEEDP